VGYQLARLLAASGLGTLYVYDDEPPDLALYPAAGVLASRSEALRSALSGCDTTVFPISHWSKPDAGRLDLTSWRATNPNSIELSPIIWYGMISPIWWFAAGATG
jgi:hypothetical protein